jgi:Holliday junction resolvase-like predicted endonuclease
MELYGRTRKDIGNLGESIAAAYLTRHGFTVIARNVSRKTGELDIVATRQSTLHAVEVKTLVCAMFPDRRSYRKSAEIAYDPSFNLHPGKLRKVARTTEWYVAEIGWGWEVQIDAILVWLRASVGCARIRYLPQII